MRERKRAIHRTLIIIINLTFNTFTKLIASGKLYTNLMTSYCRSRDHNANVIAYCR